MYLDHNAGGRVRPEVASVLAAWLRTPAGNPSSLHAAGRRARSAIETAREAVAALVGARPSEVIFTSGGTEANNLAIRGCARRDHHVVAGAIEHHSVVASVAAVEAMGSRATLVWPDREGRVSAEQVAAAIDEATTVVSVGWANGEIGSVPDVAAIVGAVRAANPATRVHSDAVQAVSQLDVDVGRVDLDLLSLSGHKLGAPAGIGALIVRRDCRLEPLLVGGPQERERRAGTENVAGIVAFGHAADLAREERAAYAARATTLREEVWAILSAGAAPVERFGSRTGLPGTLSVGFPGLRGDALAAALDLRGVAVSTGSACAAGAPEPSHVLRALGCDDELARGGLRLSFGPELAREDAQRAAREIVDVVGRARSKRAAREEVHVAP